jgi:cytochrome b6-f complex iron-sulfur subunit
MFRIAKTLLGLIFGWMASVVLGIAGRFHQNPMANQVKRRTFVRNAALGATGSVLALLGAGFGALMWPLKTGAFGSVIPVPADQVPPVDGKPYRNVPGKFWLVNTADGLMALYTKCPHLGCAVPWVGPADNPQAFQCPCHGSMFDYTGDKTGGPTPRPMDYMAIEIDPSGTVLVNTGDIKLRTEFEPSQAVKF